MNEDKFFYEMPTVLETKQEIDIIVKKGLAAYKKKRTWIKYTAMAATIVFAMLVGLAFSFPNYARQIPIIGGIFDLIFQSEMAFHTAQFQEFATPVNLIVGDDRMTIVIEEVVFDGKTVSFAYRVESAYLELIEDESVYLGHGDVFCGLLDMSDAFLEVDGVTVTRYGSFGPGQLQRISPGVYVAVGVVCFSHMDRPIERGVVHFNLAGFNIAFPIERIEGVVALPIEWSVSNEDFTITIEEFEMLPIGARFYYTYEVPQRYNSPYGIWDHLIYGIQWGYPEGYVVWIDFKVVDDLGNEYMLWGGAGTMVCCAIGQHWEGWFKLHRTLDPEARELTIIPSVTLEHWQRGDWEYTGGDFFWHPEYFVAEGGILEIREIEFDSIVISIP